MDNHIVGYISINYSGRLGNVLFELASTYGLSKKYGREFIINQNQINQIVIPANIRDYLLRKHVANKNINIDFTYDEPNQNFSYNYFNLERRYKHILLKGYFQSDMYFKDYRNDIINWFSISTENLKHAIIKYNPYNKVFIHVRRGDYLIHPFHNLFDDKYYERAMAFFSNDSDVQYLVFSDDVNFCKNQKIFAGCTFVEDGELNELETINLMKLCTKGAITANSSFSWWGAWLNENNNKKIVMPEKWMKLYPEGHLGIYFDVIIT